MPIVVFPDYDSSLIPKRPDHPGPYVLAAAY
jgi:hypothetical protein